MGTIERIPVAKDLFRWAEGAVELIGSRCKVCGTHYFPKRVSCCNPDCKDKEIIEVALSRRGRLHSYTIQSYRPPPLFKMEPWSPYAIGLIELPEGIRVMGMLTGSALDEIVIDMAMELTVEPLYRDELGRDVVTYKFKPADTGARAV
jgi:uncharacterized OB-fold protein